MKKLAVALSVILVMLVIPVIPSYSQQINGCVSKKNGALRIVESTTQCKASENALSWNQAGPPVVGSLGVYDGRGLFLGYFVQRNDNAIGYPNYLVYNADLTVFLAVEFNGTSTSPVLRAPSEITPSGYYAFASENCTGQQYIWGDASFLPRLQDLFVDLLQPPVYLIIDRDSPILRMSDLRSAKYGDDVCHSLGIPTGQAFVFPVKQIDVPLLNAKLQYPMIVEPVQ